MNNAANSAVATRYMQGIAVPESSVNPQEFFARTRRRSQVEVSRNYAGLGGQDVFELKKVDVLAGLYLRFVGSVSTTANTGSVATNARWPLDLVRKIRFTANGQSNIINVSGAKLKARDVMKQSDLTDRGIDQVIADATVNHGTLSQASESWGLGSRETAVADGTYDVDMTWFVPIAEDQQDLMGAIFAATSSTDLTVTIDWATKQELFTFGGDGTGDASVSGTVQVEALRYSIPLGGNGQIVIPDLSTFHSLIETRHTGLGNGENETRLVGQGAGKTLLRTFTQLWNGDPTAPVAVNAANFNKLAWRYGGNETPDEYSDGQVLRYINERMYNCDIGAHHGFFAHEFASENAFRDSVDLGTTSEWRQVIGISNDLALTSPALEVVAESIYTAGAGA